MGDNRSPDDADLAWPVARGELDDLETLELGRDAAGRLAWQNMTPPGQDTYRAWLPKHGHGTPAPPPDDAADVSADDPLTSLFASEATVIATREPMQHVEAPAAPALEHRVEPSLTRAPASSAEPLRELPKQAEEVSTVVVAAPSTEPLSESDVATPTLRIPLRQSSPPATTSIPFSSTAVTAPLRLSLEVTPIEGRHPVRISLPPIALQTRTRVERLALLGTGALIGVMASMVFGVAWRPDERPASAAAERPSPAPPAEARVPVAPPAVPAAPLAIADVPAAQPVASDIAPVPTSPPMPRVAPVQGAAAAVPSRRAEPPAPRTARAPGATVTATPPAASPEPIAAPPEVQATVDRFAAAYNRMDASATQAVWPAADHQALVTTFSALREQRLTLSQCRGTMNGDTATVMCRGTLRYRPRVGNHDTRIVAGTWRFTMVQRADAWVVENVESP